MYKKKHITVFLGELNQTLKNIQSRKKNHGPSPHKKTRRSKDDFFPSTISQSSHSYKSYMNHDTRRACTPAAASVLSIGTRRGPALPRAAANNNRLAAPPIRPTSAAGS